MNTESATINTGHTDYKYCRFWNDTTPEDIESMLFSIEALVWFDDFVLLTRVNYLGEILAAIYRADPSPMPQDPEARIHLVTVASQTFKDSGHALAWALTQI